MRERVRVSERERERAGVLLLFSPASFPLFLDENVWLVMMKYINSADNLKIMMVYCSL